MAPPSIQGATALDHTLTDLISLSLLANQIRWNLTGPAFSPVRRLLGELADRAGDGADSVAERAVIIGHHPDGRVEVIARRNVLPTVDPGPVPDVHAIALFDTALGTVITRLRTAMDAVADDLVTGDLFISIARDLERAAWVFRAHGQ